MDFSEESKQQQTTTVTVSADNESSHLKLSNKDLRAVRFQCKFCRKRFRSEGVYQSHTRLHRGSTGTPRVFRCRVCGTGHSGLIAFTEHQRQHELEQLIYSEHVGQNEQDMLDAGATEVIASSTELSAAESTTTVVSSASPTFSSIVVENENIDHSGIINNGKI